MNFKLCVPSNGFEVIEILEYLVGFHKTLNINCVSAWKEICTSSFRMLTVAEPMDVCWIELFALIEGVL